MGLFYLLNFWIMLKNIPHNDRRPGRHHCGPHITGLGADIGSDEKIFEMGTWSMTLTIAQGLMGVEEEI